ncbi:MAG: histidine kinase [Bacteroidota bacterium]
MYTACKILWICLCLLLLSAAASAQLKFEQAVRYTEEDGLANNGVRDIVQGPDGFIWLGTANGLCRFDGSRFKTYRHNPSDSSTIIDNRILCLTVDDHHLWIGTHAGLSRMDLKKETFVNYHFQETGKRPALNYNTVQQIRAIGKDKEGEIWVGTRVYGVAHYLPEQDDFRMYQTKASEVIPFFPNPARTNNILSIEAHHDNDSIIWAGTTRGLLKINKHLHTLRWLHFEEQKLGDKPNGFRRIYHHDDGRIYAGSWGDNTLKVFDPVTETIKLLPIKDGPWLSIAKTSIDKIYRKSKKEIWITSFNGLLSYHTEKEEVNFWKKRDVHEMELYGLNYIDDQNRAWLVGADGLFLFDPVQQQFAPYRYENPAMPGWEYARLLIPNAEEPQKVIVANNTGEYLYCFDKSTGELEIIPFFVKHFGAGETINLFDIDLDAQGRWWVSCERGLFIYDVQRRELQKAAIKIPTDFGLTQMLFWDSKSQLWLAGTNGAVLCYDAKSGRSRIFKEEIQVGGPRLYTNTFRNFYEDSQHKIWFSRVEGYSIYDPEQDHFLHAYYPRDSGRVVRNVYGFAEDQYGRIWMNAENGQIGYINVDEPEEGVTFLDLKKRHRFGVTQRVVADKKGTVWCFANDLLIKVNTADLTSTAYLYEYGIDRPGFSTFDLLPTGELALAGRNQLWLAKPEELQPNQEIPRPYISDIEVLGQDYSTDTATYRLRHLDLKANENFFTLEFSALGFTLGNKNEFRYRLLGFNEEWIDAGSRRFASYTNMSGGDYTFQLQAANNEGVWNPELAELSIFVATPWWATWWARLLALWFIAVVAFAAYRYKTAQIRKEEQLKADFEVQLAEVEMTALRAQMNPHFLFNCLNSIESFIIRNETKKASEYLSGFARLIRLILQNSRSKLVNLKDELEALELYMQMESLRFKDKFQYDIRIDKSIDIHAIDIPPMLMQPYIENAIWHGLMYKKDKHDGKVILSIRQSNGAAGPKLHCSIEDNGVGRTWAQEIKNSRPDRGKKSVGMRITKDRINMINKLYQADTSVKIIDLKNAAGEACGTRIELEIPIEP